jgi:hypothetical protein
MNSIMLASPALPNRREHTAIIGKPGRYLRHGDDYVSRFNRLVRRWRAETAYVSSSSQLFGHPAFAEIVSMGEVVVPLIIAELRRQPDALVGALTMITGESPVSSYDRGDMYAMASAWVEWYQRRR